MSNSYTDEKIKELYRQICCLTTESQFFNDVDWDGDTTTLTFTRGDGTTFDVILTGTGGVDDGDYGDVVVLGGVWTVENHLPLSGGTMSGAINMGSQLITNLLDPVSAQDAATKAYTDNFVLGLSWKSSVRAATTTAGTLASDFENGDIIDGVTLATGDRILIKNQATATENGVYVVSLSGAPTRSTDANSGAELVSATVLVQEGTVNAETQWTQSTNAPITLGVTNLVFVQVAGTGIYLPLAGGTMTGSILASPDNSIDLGSGSFRWRTGYFGTDLILTANGGTIKSNSTSLGAPQQGFVIQLNNSTIAGITTSTTGEVKIGALATGGFFPVLYANNTARLSFTPTEGQATFTPAPTTGSGVSITTSTITSGTALTITGTGTGNLSGAKMLEINSSGTNSNSSVTKYGIYSSVTNTGTTSTNVAGYFSASGASNNYPVQTSGGLGSGGVILAGLNSTYGGVWSANVTPSSSNYMVVSNGSNTVLNSETAGSTALGSGGVSYFTVTSGVATLATLPTTGNGFSFSNSTVTSGNLMAITKTGTAALTGATGLNISFSGANSNASQTTYGLQVANTSTGSGTNYGLNINASGGTTNYALKYTAGSGGGLYFGSYGGGSTDGTIWSAAVTPSNTNWAFSASSTTTAFNATGNIQFVVGNSLLADIQAPPTTGNGFAMANTTLTTGNLMNLSSTSTANTGTSATILNISKSGTHAASSVTSYGAQISVTNAGTTSTNIGLKVSASGASTNYGLLVSNGYVGVNNDTPLGQISVTASAGSFANSFGNNLTLDGAAPSYRLWATGTSNGWQVGTTGGSLYFGALSAITTQNYRMAMNSSGGLTLFGTSGSSTLLSGVLNIPVAPTATANYGTVSIGSGAWDGSTAPFFSGSASGTHFSIHAASGFAGNFADWQTAGLRVFSFSADGNIGFGTTGNVNIRVSNDGSTAANSNGRSLVFTTNNFSTSIYHLNANLGSAQSTSGATGGLNLNQTFAAGAGSATYRPLNIAYTINNSGVQSGTATGIYLNATETALNSMTHNLIDLQVGAASKFSVSNTGLVTVASHLHLASYIRPSSGSFSVYNPLTITNANQEAFAFNSVTFGGSSSEKFGLAVGYTVNQSGTAGYTGLIVRGAETATGSGTKRLLDLQAGAAGTTSMFSVSNVGVVTAASTVTGTSLIATTNFFISGKSVLASSLDGLFTISNNAGTDFTRLILGTNDASGVSIKKNGTAINFRLGDDSADANITAADITSSTNVLAVNLVGTGFSRAGSASYLGWTNRARIYSPDDLTITLQNFDVDGSFNMLQFGGTTSSFSGIKNSGTTLAIRLADDSADAAITAARVTSSETVITAGYTFATLPATPVAGMRAYITDSPDSPAFLSTATGGGTAVVPVFFNGTDWLVG